MKKIIKKISFLISKITESILAFLLDILMVIIFYFIEKKGL
ncbi:hypothetical protein FUSNEC_GEN_277_04900 [Fusobacterium necrophorum subsp. funduliforme]